MTTVILKGGERIVPIAVNFPYTIHSLLIPGHVTQMHITDAYSHTGLKVVKYHTPRPPRVEQEAVIIRKYHTPRPPRVEQEAVIIRKYHTTRPPRVEQEAVIIRKTPRA